MKKMELDLEEMNQVAGGNAFINHNTKKMVFDSFDEVYVINTNVCTSEEVAALCKSYIGKCSSKEDYDTTCRDALKAKGWI